MVQIAEATWKERMWGSRFHGSTFLNILFSIVEEFRKMIYATRKLRPQPHLIIAEPQVRPAPNPAAAIVCPGFTFPLRTASSNANGMEAALVLP